ncbi:FAD/NAD(P)-binding protein [Streptomyces sp. HU2014]|uniref:FAD/NAD(P)-binding protein n=1 Tax=Streptomyces sp. HU2014 TaxID=2939414 RepID=UPI00200C9FE4|nr:FAD/NAD(P)-binding domain-containing protein [Streptomyces sp. HU2014]UQI44980.1 FAD/NAD(P)-binding protein [Streptomyces sp. HU2014]
MPVGRTAESDGGGCAGELRERPGPGRDVVVIGGGVAGTSFVVQLVRELLGARDRAGGGRPPSGGRIRSVRLVDPNPPGWGLAFGDRDPLLLCNTAAEINSLLADRPGDFIDHLREQGLEAGPLDCVPRARMAAYCHDRFDRARARARELGVEVRHVRGTAGSVTTGAAGHRVRLGDGQELRADEVVVATGVHRPRVPDGFAAFQDHPRYLDSPYPAARIRQRLPAGSTVLVLGSHQSAIDAALLLCRDGHRVTLTSPSGLLPAVRVSLAAPVRAFPPLERLARLDPADPLLEERVLRCAVESVRLLSRVPLRRQTSRAADPLQRLREETALVERDALWWPGIMVALMEALIALGPSLPPGRTEALLSRFARLTGRYVTAMTSRNARRLLAHAESGALRLAGSYPGSVAFEDGAWRVERPGAAPERFDYAVNATGFLPPALCWNHDGTGLYLDAPPGAGAAVDHLEADLRVRRGPGAPPERIWVVGVGTHVRVPFSNLLGNVVRQAGQVARELAGAEVPV